MNDIIASVDRLSRLETDGQRVLSVYISTDPSRGPGRNLKAHVNDVLQTVRSGATAELEALDAEIARVRERLEGLSERPRGLAVFSSTALGLDEAVALPIAPNPTAHWGRRVSLRPLLALLDEYEPTLVLLVDKERARAFRWVLDSMEELESIEDDVPGKHSQGGEAQANLQRHHEERVQLHVRHAVELLTRHLDAEGVKRVALGGPSEVLAQFRKLLPQQVASRVAGTIGVAVAAPAHEVLDAAREVREEWERAEEIRLLEGLEENIGRARAVRGTGDVVDAVREQRVRTLVYAAGTGVPGGRCRSCEILYDAPVPDSCAACGNNVDTIDDMLDILASRVLHSGGTIEEVRGPAADALREHDGIAAELLYAAPVAERA